MKNAFIILFAVLFGACNPKSSSQNAEKDSTSMVQKNNNIGGNKDEHGCLITAGYTWSILNNECIRVFEQNKLLPVNEQNGYTEAAYFLFNNDNTKAELFIPKEKQSIILERTGTEENYIWKKDDFQIFGWKGYALSKKGKVIFHGE